MSAKRAFSFARVLNLYLNLISLGMGSSFWNCTSHRPNMPFNWVMSRVLGIIKRQFHSEPQNYVCESTMISNICGTTGPHFVLKLIKLLLKPFSDWLTDGLTLDAMNERIGLPWHEIAWPGTGTGQSGSVYMYGSAIRWKLCDCTNRTRAQLGHLAFEWAQRRLRKNVNRKNYMQKQKKHL